MIHVALQHLVLYLDFDGVLHEENVRWSIKRGIYMATPGHHLWEWMSILEELLAPFPDVKIVLSTSWVHARNFNYAKSRLSPVLQTRVIGATFHRREMRKDVFLSYSRGWQIAGDVSRRRPRAWFALDDDTEGWPAHLLENLVATDGTRGLSDPAVQAAVTEKLRQLSSGM